MIIDFVGETGRCKLGGVVKCEDGFCVIGFYTQEWGWGVHTVWRGREEKEVVDGWIYGGELVYL